MSSSYDGMPDFNHIPLAYPPPGVTPNFDNPPSAIWQFTIVSTIGSTLAFLCLGLRLYTRIILLGTSGLEDLFLVLAFLLGIVEAVIGNEMGKSGLGIHGWNVPLSHLPRFLLLNFISIVIYQALLLFVKLAILGLFFRLNPQKFFRHMVWTVTIIVIASTFGAYVSLLLRCHPVSDEWSIHNPHCKNNRLEWVLATGAVNIITDFMMLALSIPMLWAVLMPKRQKTGLTLVIMTGSAVCFLSIARLILLAPALTNPDTTYMTLKVGILSHLEGQVAVICACLPTLKPFFKQHLKGLMIKNTEINTSSYTQFSQANKNVVSSVDANGKIKLTTIKKGTSHGAMAEPTLLVLHPRGFAESQESVDEVVRKLA